MANRVKIDTIATIPGWSGRQRSLEVCESEERIDGQTLVKLLRSNGRRLAAYVIRGYMDRQTCKRIEKRFWNEVEAKKREDGIGTFRVGTTHYGYESLAEYGESTREVREDVFRVLGEDSDVVTRLFGRMRGAVSSHGELDDGTSITGLRTAKVNGQTVTPVVIRHMQGQSNRDKEMSLLIHQDSDQLRVPEQRDFEAQQVRHPRTANLYLANDGQGTHGKLRIYNAKHEHVEKAVRDAERELGWVKKTTLPGWYYAQRRLRDLKVPFEDIEVGPGDVVLLNNGLLHGVTEALNRLSIAFFFGLIEDIGDHAEIEPPSKTGPGKRNPKTPKNPYRRPPDQSERSGEHKILAWS